MWIILLDYNNFSYRKVIDYNFMAYIFIIAVNILYFVMYGYEYSIVGEIATWDVIGIVFISLVTYGTHKAVIYAMENEYGYSYYQDIFIVNLFTQFLISFTRNGWYVYLLIPIYLGYLASGFIWSYLSKPKEYDDDDTSKLSKAEQKKLEKKRKKEEKPKVKYVH